MKRRHKVANEQATEQVTIRELREEGWRIILPIGHVSDDTRLVRPLEDRFALWASGQDRLDRDFDAKIGWKSSYLYDAEKLVRKSGWKTILRLVNSEIFESLHSYPLTSVRCAFEYKMKSPLLFSVCEFPDKQARALSLRMDLMPSEDSNAGEIPKSVLMACYAGVRPPSSHGDVERFSKELIAVRLYVLHEIGHHLLHQKVCDEYSDNFGEVGDNSGEVKDKMEQEADLFALLMSGVRGWPTVEDYERDELCEFGEAVELDRIAERLDICIDWREHRQPAGFIKADDLLKHCREKNLRRTGGEPKGWLIDDMRIGEIQKIVREVTLLAEESILSWALRGIVARKNDLQIIYDRCPESESISDRVTCEMVKAKSNRNEQTKKEWRRYHVPIVKSTSGGARLKARAEIAKKLGLIRLYEPPANQSRESEFCLDHFTKAQKESAAFYSLALHALRGKLLKHERLDQDHIRFLANLTSSGIGPLVSEYDDELFAGFVNDPDCPEADRVYTGHIAFVRGQEIECELVDAEGELYSVCFDKRQLENEGIDIDIGNDLKVFEVDGMCRPQRKG